MRPLAIMALALAFAATASAHIVGKPHGHTLKQTIAFQEKQYAHARYVCVRGSGEPKRWHCAASKFIKRELDASRAKLVPVSPVAAISAVFGPYASQAIAVAQCESGLSVYATNGQYLGMFQMGSYARARYGHSYTAYGQARSAYAYFRDSGYSWSPWECKP